MPYFNRKCRIDGNTQKTDVTYQVVYHMMDVRGQTEIWTITPQDILSFARQISLAMVGSEFYVLSCTVHVLPRYRVTTLLSEFCGKPLNI